MDAAALREAAIAAHHRARCRTSVRRSSRSGSSSRRRGCPSPLLNQIKRLAAFQNPEFYKKQSMRLSTAMTPRVIACAEDLPQHVALPRGCRTELEELLREHGVALDVDDERVAGEPLALRFRGTLTPVQDRRRARCSRTTSACSSRRPASARRSSARTSSPREPAARWSSSTVGRCSTSGCAQLSLFLGIEPKEIGQIGAGKRRPQRPARRGDDPEPRAQGDGRGPRRELRAGHRRRVPPPARRSRSSACWPR